MPRDSQKNRFYDTERRSFREVGGYPMDFPTDRDIQLFVNEVTGSKFWKTMGGRPVIVKPTKRNNESARGWHQQIKIPPWARTKCVVLHELSHSLVGYQLLDYTHGPEFVLVYRRLIEEHMGLLARQTFDHEAEILNVKWGIGNLSPQKIAAAI